MDRTFSRCSIARSMDAGVNRETGKRQQVRRHYATEKEARDALAKITQQAATDSFIPRKAVTVEELCDDWLASLHNARATTINGYTYCLAPLREQHGHLAAQKLNAPRPGQAAHRASRWGHHDREGPHPAGVVGAVDQQGSRRMADSPCLRRRAP